MNIALLETLNYRVVLKQQLLFMHYDSICRDYHFFRSSVYTYIAKMTQHVIALKCAIASKRFNKIKIANIARPTLADMG